MCPICDVVKRFFSNFLSLSKFRSIFKCPFWYLSDICSYARLGVFFDHPGTVFYAIFMSFWGKSTNSNFQIFPTEKKFLSAVIFLKHWKQKNAEISHRWDLMEFEEEEVRRSSSIQMNSSQIFRF